jgi:hypothetical protein
MVYDPELNFQILSLPRKSQPEAGIVKPPHIFQMVIDYENVFPPSCLKHFIMGG